MCIVLRVTAMQNVNQALQQTVLKAEFHPKSSTLTPLYFSHFCFCILKVVHSFIFQILCFKCPCAQIMDLQTSVAASIVKYSILKNQNRLYKHMLWVYIRRLALPHDRGGGCIVLYFYIFYRLLRKHVYLNLHSRGRG